MASLCSARVVATEGKIFDRHGHRFAIALFVLAFVAGGSSERVSLTVSASQLLALPLLVWSVSMFPGMEHSRFRRLALGAMLLTFGVIALQLLPVPQGWWEAIDVRRGLLGDLEAVGVARVRHGWGLSAHAAERALWSMLPAMALFVTALVVPARRWRIMLLAVVVAVAASLLLGVLQQLLGQHSLVNLHPQWAPRFNGVFANPNHQGTALAIAAVVLASLWIPVPGHRVGATRAAARVVAVAAIYLSILLTGSRAASLLGAIGMAIAWLLLRVSPALPGRTSRKRWVGRLLPWAAMGAAVGALAWLGLGGADIVRWRLVMATATMGWEHAPLGAGTGTFAAWFDQMAPRALVQWEYFNHAHNEYVQWWYEGGVVAIGAIVGVVAILLAASPRGAGRPDCSTPGSMGSSLGRDAVAAWLGCGVLLLHSIVDYPLRTPALMAAGGLLAGIMVAARVEAARRSGKRPPATSD